MQPSTKTALAAIISADATIDQKSATRALALLSGAELPRPMGRVVRAKEAARLCGVTTKTIRTWAANGALVPVRPVGSRTCAGYTETSVRALLSGGNPVPAGV